MAQIIKPKRKHTAGAPTTSDLEANEIAINTTDYSIYVRDDSNNILRVGGVQTPMNQDLDTNGFEIKDNNSKVVKFTSPLRMVNVTTTEMNALTTLVGGYFVIGFEYQIETVGTTDFTAIGASANVVGTIFTATGVGSGTGTAFGGEQYYGMMAYNTTSNRMAGYEGFNDWNFFSV